MRACVVRNAFCAKKKIFFECGLDGKFIFSRESFLADFATIRRIFDQDLVEGNDGKYSVR